MNKIFAILSFALAVTLASAAPRISDHQVAPYRSGYRNYVKNASAQKNTLNVTTSSAAVARVTTAGYKLDGLASFTCDTSANGGYCEFTLDTIENPDDSGNCAFTGEMNGDGSLYSARITDGSGNALNTVALGSVTAWTPFEVTYPCGSARKVRIVQTTAGTSPAVNLGHLNYGRWTGGTTTSQAQIVGTIKISGCSSAHSNTSTTLATLGTQTSCTYTTSGQAQAPSTNLIAIKFPALDKGDYEISFEGTIEQSTASKSAYYQFTDGTNTARELSSIFSAGASDHTGVRQTFTLTAPSSSPTWELFAKNDSAGTAKAYATAAVPGVIVLKRFPTAPETGFRADTAAVSWSGYQTVASGWSTSSSTYVDPSSGTTIVLNATTARNMTCVTNASSKAGLDCTLPKAGVYKVCAGFTASASATSSLSGRLVDGSGTVIDPGRSYGVTGTTETGLTLCGKYNVTSTASATTFKIQTANSGSLATVIQNARGSGGAIQWDIENVDQGLSAPVVLGSRSELRFNTHAGYGSTGTLNPYYTNVDTTNQGTALSYSNSSVTGLVITINENGVYTACATAAGGATAAVGIGITKNYSTAGTSISTIPVANRLGWAYVGASTGAIQMPRVCATEILSLGDVLRPNTEAASVPSSNAYTEFAITKVQSL